MSYSFAKGGWEVRWRDATGASARERFAARRPRRAFDESIHEHELAERRSGGPARTAAEASIRTRPPPDASWRYVVRRTDGTQTSKRGFTSERAARDASRRLIEKQERREVRHTKETFGAFWERWLTRRKPYLEPGTWQRTSATAACGSARARLGRRSAAWMSSTSAA